jgi:predicted dehydrogenase
MSINPPLNRKLRMSLVGGGQGSFIGRIHVMAATLDHRAVLVAGALSADADKARSSAAVYGIAPDRAYASYRDMAAAEARLPPGERIDFVSIATPNHTHFDIARTFAAAGFNILCDKPMTINLQQAEELARLVQETGIVFAVTHNYTGHALVRQARDMVRAGALGEINAIRVSYLQGNLRRSPEDLRKRAAWKSDPAKAGPSGCFGDIGTHAYNLARYVASLVPERLACHLRIFEKSQPLDDYGTAAITFSNGALGTITASRISHGRANELRIDIDGTRGSLAWYQEEPNRMWFHVNGQPHQLYTRDPHAPYQGMAARASCRLPAGHPEGFLQAFANIYTAAFDDMILRATGKPLEKERSFYPNVADGVDGVNFLTQCVASARQDGAWVSLKHPLFLP